jgi:hypothetical protein
MSEIDFARPKTSPEVTGYLVVLSNRLEPSELSMNWPAYCFCAAHKGWIIDNGPAPGAGDLMPRLSQSIHPDRCQSGRGFCSGQSPAYMPQYGVTL